MAARFKTTRGVQLHAGETVKAGVVLELGDADGGLIEELLTSGAIAPADESTARRIGWKYTKQWTVADLRTKCGGYDPQNWS